MLDRPLTTVNIRSYAKLNIALDVLDKRLDGYHDIESVIQPISLHDVMSVTRTSGHAISLESSNPAVPCDEGNLAYRAAVLFLEASRLDSGININIEKHIPMEAGLGGGSSNAAATLVALNRLFGQPLDKEIIRGLCARLGSDVPLFLIGGTVFASGRGEILEPLPDLPLHFVVIKPDFGISTAWAYKTLSEMQRSRRGFSQNVARATGNDDIKAAIAAMGNDFELVADFGFPEIPEIRRELVEQGANRAMLAGSGSAVFGVFIDSDTCNSAYEALKPQYARCFRARTILHEELRTQWIHQ